MLLRSSSFNSSASFSLEPAGSGSGTASTSAQSDKRAGPAAAGSSTLSVISSSSAYRPTHLSLDQARSFKQTIPTLLSPNRAYHDDQAYIGLPSPLSPSSSNESVPDLHCRGRYLLPCPPTSPSGRRVRFGLNECQSDLRRALGWVRDRVFPTPRQMAYSTGKEHRPNLHTPSKSAHSGQNLRSPNPAFWIVLYFTLNLSLTLYNKYVLIHFPFPYTLTALHALCGTVGTCIMLHLVGMGKPSASPGEKELTTKSSVSPIPNLTLKETVVVLLFSMLYTVNIVVSNASLKLVTVPFHQVVRGSTPLFTIALSALLFNKRSSRAKLIALIPVIAGVGFATYGDYYCTLFGFCLTLFGTVLAAFKTVVTHLFLQSPSSSSALSKRRLSDEQPIEKGSPHRRRRVPPVFMYNGGRKTTSLSTSISDAFQKLDLPKLSLTPLQLLYLMSPLAFIQTTLLAHYTGELAAVNRHLHSAGYIASASTSSHSFLGWGFGLGAFGGLGRIGLGGLGIGMPSGWLIMNGIMAFALNVVSFNANKRIGAVGMSVAANVKQVLTVLCAVALFDLTMSVTNGVGIGLTLVGGAWYAQLEVREKREKEKENENEKRSG
ncbi:TPT-domain-containing protein [Coprinellus micaceus]|uniref:TPT-domain-containing protein n=1 Tax=Coprinellus micaceus TaxID=71717 RepID=A0A4Y7TEQ9_COPMI|nr:TPT-domain-containing protein [Coprinellus micaceus]